MQKFDTTAPIAAVLDVSVGRIEFVAAERPDTEVEVLPADTSRNRDVAAAEQTTVDYADGVLRIRSNQSRNQLLGPSGSVIITVGLPAGSSVRATADGFELRGTGRLGDVAFDGAYRRIRIDEAASARLTAIDGDVEVGRLGGPAEISTARGDIRIDEAVSGTVVLRTSSGGISVGAAAGSSASLDADTSYGRVRNTLRNADGAAAQLEIRASTAYGDIAAHSL